MRSFAVNKDLDKIFYIYMNKTAEPRSVLNKVKNVVAVFDHNLVTAQVHIHISFTNYLNQKLFGNKPVGIILN